MKNNLRHMISSTALAVLLSLGVYTHCIGETMGASSSKAVTSSATTPQKTTQTSNLQTLDKILAIVNNDVITESDLAERIKIVKMQLQRAKVKMPDASSLQKQVLQQMIDERLQLQAADKLNISIDNDTLNNAINSIAKQNHMTLTQFKRELTKDGINYQDFRNEVRDELLISRAQEREVKPHVIVTTQEVDNFLAAFKQVEQKNLEYRVEDIVINLPDSPSPEQIQQTKAKAEEILHKVQNGADFEVTATAESSGEQALSGGDLGWRNLARLPTVFAERVQNMQKGDIVGPIRTSNGFHIIKLADVRGNTNTHFITETNARHILIKTNAVMTDAKARAEVMSLRRQITKGASFAALAKQHSDDPGSANQGGDLGWVTDDQLVPEFAEVMDTLKPHQLSQPVKSPFGWHLIEVQGRRKKDVTKQYTHNRIQNMISQRKYEEAIVNWTRQLRAQAYVNVMSN